MLLEGKELIENIKKDSERTPQSIVEKLKSAVETISVDINTEPTTFIFELIQNADDYPNEKNNVFISFEINESYLIIKHNGSPFEVNNTVAICGVNDGDKRTDKNKIGFKGIGFKSIFKDSNFAYIKSGDFSFRFDEMYWRDQGKEMFWHITPINTEPDEYKQVLKEEANVNIVLRPKEPKALQSYEEIFLNYFRNEKILLFLRNIKALNFISKIKSNSFEISNLSSNWKVLREENIEIPKKEIDELNRLIRFSDKRIPVKFFEISQTEIGFGFKMSETKIELISDGSIYSYLPTKINLGFPFIINGNFIPDASRTNIYSDLTWNCFLFKKAGELFINQIIKLINDGYDKESVLLVIPVFSEMQFVQIDEKRNSFFNEFKEGFDKVFLNKPFIPSKQDNLEILSDILIDETGLVEFLGTEFSELTNINAKLVHDNIGQKGKDKIKSLISEYKKGVIFDIERFRIILLETKFQNWLKEPVNNFRLIEFFNSELALKSLLKTEKIILSENKELCTACSLYNKIPNELDFLGIDKINSELSVQLTEKNIELDFVKFDEFKFFRDIFFDQYQKINTNFLKDKLNLLSFWRFVYNNWELLKSDNDITNSLKNFNVLCKIKDKETLYCKEISEVYLSREFDTDSEIEGVVEEIDANAFFISDEYIQSGYVKESWKKIFKKVGVIANLKGMVNILLKELSKLPKEMHFEVARQTFSLWRDNKDNLSRDQFDLMKNGLMIKCIDEEFRKPFDCFLSNHYNNKENQLMASLLPILNIPNQIINAYGESEQWYYFFKQIGCTELLEKQEVLNKKLEFYISKQNEFRHNHFEILKSVSDLFRAKNENKLNFNNDVLSKIELQSVDESWHLPNKIHLSSIYGPKLNLQNEEFKIGNLFFLNESYKPEEIDKNFLIDTGVQEDFLFINSDLKRNDIPEWYRNEFEKKDSRIATNAIRWSSQHKLNNHLTINYIEILEQEKYACMFWEKVVKNNEFGKILFQQSTYQYYFGPVHFENYVVSYIKSNALMPSKSGSMRKTSELFSYVLSSYIKYESILPKFDLSELKNEEGKSLESHLGINQLLSVDLALELISNKDVKLSVEEVEKLQLVNILRGVDYQEDKEYYLPNVNFKWVASKRLIFSRDENFPHQLDRSLHRTFIDIADHFKVQELSESTLITKTEPYEPKKSSDIEIFFKENTKFIAFKIKQESNQEFEEELINRFTSIEFYEVDSISRIFPEINSVYFEKRDFLFNESDNNFIYKGNWKSNREVINFLHELIGHERIEKKWFENVVNRWNTRDILKNLRDSVGEPPLEWNVLGGNDELEDDDDEEATQNGGSSNSYNKLIGNKGEKFVYDYLLEKYSHKEVELNETENGFKILSNENTIDIEVIWNNKVEILANIRSQNDSLLPYDLEVTEGDKTFYIEVKSTSKSKKSFQLTESELQFMLEKQQQYQIWRVINLDFKPKKNEHKEMPLISHKLLAFEALKKGLLSLRGFPIEMKINQG